MEPLASQSISRVLVFVLSLHGMLFMGPLPQLRTHMMKENESGFEINGNAALMITAIATLLMVEITSGILFLTNISSYYYKVLKFLGIFSASIDSFLLLLVLEISPSMFYVLSLVLYGITMAYLNSGNDGFDKSLQKTSPVSVFTYIGLVLLPLALGLVLFVPKDLDWIVYPVIYTIMGIEMMFFLITYFIFMFINEEKPKAHNLEAHQNKNNSDSKPNKTGNNQVKSTLS